VALDKSEGGVKDKSILLVFFGRLARTFGAYATTTEVSPLSAVFEWNTGGNTGTDGTFTNFHPPENWGIFRLSPPATYINSSHGRGHLLRCLLHRGRVFAGMRGHRERNRAGRHRPLTRIVRPNTPPRAGRRCPNAGVLERHASAFLLHEPSRYAVQLHSENQLHVSDDTAGLQRRDHQ
jgi:hypothetical protein